MDFMIFITTTSGLKTHSLIFNKVNTKLAYASQSFKCSQPIAVCLLKLRLALFSEGM